MADAAARRIAVRGAALALAMLLLPACTDQTKVHETELSELLVVLLTEVLPEDALRELSLRPNKW